MSADFSPDSSTAGQTLAVDAASDAASGARKVHIETWGCQMNVADSERMLAALSGRGYALTDRPEDADLILLNTCHIREKARQKVLSRLGRLRDFKVARPGLRIAVAGCVAQADGRRLMDAAPQIDVLVGPGKLEELPRLLDERERTGRGAMAVGFARHDHAHEHEHEHQHDHDHENGPESTRQPEPAVTAKAPPTLTGQREVSRFVTIQNGCNNYCAFCVVPFTRGREVSRSPAEVLAEARAMVAAGAREVTLLGQNVNSYGLDLVESGRLAGTADGPFVDLLKAVAALPGLARLRFTSSNPHDFTRALAGLYASTPVMGRYLHLPVQAGSDRVLERMKRKVTVAEYRERLAWIRAACPDVAISTDLIVGFPGETEEDFEATLALVAEARFSFAYSFKYSPRRNTPAARWDEQLTEAEKEHRLARLNALQDAITLEHHRAEIGQTRPVLFHYESAKNPGHYFGRTEHFRLVRAASKTSLVGALRPVRILEGNKTGLLGELAD